MIVAYARTSTTDQVAGLAGQERDLRAAGAEKVYSEQASSVAERAVLDEALKFVREGDTLMVSKPDRLARSTSQLLQIVEELEMRKVGLVILSMGGERLDTRNPTSKLMLTVLAGVAAWEREIMLERQREGVTEAKAAGKYIGRKPLARSKVDRIKTLAATGGMTRQQIADQIGVSAMTVYRVLKG